MRRISDKEFRKLEFIGVKKSNFVQRCYELRVGEMLHITQEEWWNKFGYVPLTTPSSRLLVAQWDAEHGKSTCRPDFEQMKFRTGKAKGIWVIERLA